MKIEYAQSFNKDYKDIPDNIKKKFTKQVLYLKHDLRHRSLDAKKYDEKKDIWQARVDRNYRFYFLINGDTYTLLKIRQHP